MGKFKIQFTFLFLSLSLIEIQAIPTDKENLINKLIEFSIKFTILLFLFSFLFFFNNELSIMTEPTTANNVFIYIVFHIYILYPWPAPPSWRRQGLNIVGVQVAVSICVHEAIKLRMGYTAFIMSKSIVTIKPLKESYFAVWSLWSGKGVIRNALQHRLHGNELMEHPQLRAPSSVPWRWAHSELYLLLIAISFEHLLALWRIVTFLFRHNFPAGLYHSIQSEGIFRCPLQYQFECVGSAEHLPNKYDIIKDVDASSGCVLCGAQ